MNHIISLPESYHKLSGGSLTNITNISFIYPLYYLYNSQKNRLSSTYSKLLYIHICLLLLCSTYYHSNPTKVTILPDMCSVATLTLLFTFILVDIPSKYSLLIYIISISSVYYFHYSGNLLPYILVIGGIPAYAVYRLWNKGYNKELLKIILLLISSRLCEHNDKYIYNMGKMINGHSVKHILSAVAIVELLKLLKKLHKI